MGPFEARLKGLIARCRSTLALLIAGVVLASTASAAVAANPVPPGYSFAGYASQLYVGGIDGYLGWNSGNYNALGVLTDPDNQHILNWLGVYQDPEICGAACDWYQVGLYQGSIGQCPASPCLRSPTAVRMYAEGNHYGNANDYRIVDLGAVPSAPNEAFYIWNTGSRDLDTQRYVYDVRYGSWNSQVRDTYELSELTLPAWSLQELANGSGLSMSVNTGYFGMSNSGGWRANQSYGLHLYQGSSGWNVWTSSYSGIYCDNVQLGQVCPISEQPPAFHAVSAPWYSFYTTQ